MRNIYIGESIIDPKRKELDDEIWDSKDGTPVIMKDIEEQIYSDIEEFSNIADIKDFYLVGSITGLHWTETSDLDVNIEIDKDSVDEDKKDELMELLKEINGRPAGDTSHPINYHFNFVEDGENISDNFDGIYDIEDDEWVKEPKDEYIDPSDYKKKFKRFTSDIDECIMELKRNMYDLTYIIDADKDTFEDDITKDYNDLMNAVFDSIEDIIDIEKDLADARRDGYVAMDDEKLEKLGSKNALPLNIIYKMAEKYGYVDFAADLRDIQDEVKDEDGEFIGEYSDEDIDNIIDAIERFEEIEEP